MKDLMIEQEERLAKEQEEFWMGYDAWSAEMDAKSFAQDLHEANEIEWR